MSDILNRLRGYNPPDRCSTLQQQQIAQDIQEAADEIERLRRLQKAMDAEVAVYEAALTSRE
jgi:hypothetical protein